MLLRASVERFDENSGCCGVSVPGWYRSSISYDVPNKPIMDNYIGANGTSNSEKRTAYFFISDAPKETHLAD